MSLGAFTGSVPDVIGATLGVAEAMRAGKGFGFNACVFQIKTPTSPTAPTGPPKPASSASQTPSPATTSASTPSRQGNLTPPKVQPGPVIFEVTSGSIGEGGPAKVAQLGLRQVVFESRSVVAVELRLLNLEFDAGLDSVLVELLASTADTGGAFLTLKGFANPGGSGYAHFSAGIHVLLGPDGRLNSQVAYVSQAPGPGAGTGIFGKTIFVNNRKTFVGIQMERRPLFTR